MLRLSQYLEWLVNNACLLTLAAISEEAFSILFTINPAQLRRVYLRFWGFLRPGRGLDLLNLRRHTLPGVFAITEARSTSLECPACQPVHEVQILVHQGHKQLGTNVQISKPPGHEYLVRAETTQKLPHCCLIDSGLVRVEISSCLKGGPIDLHAPPAPTQDL